MVGRIALAAFTGLLLAVAATVAPAQLPTQSGMYRYQALNRDLADVLRGFAADQRLSLVLDPAIERHVVSEEVELSPSDFLNYITGKYGLVWYYDGVSLYIDRGDRLETRAFSLRYTSPPRVIEAMKSLHAYSDRFPFRILDKEKVILAVGPPRLLQMTAFVVNTLEASGKTSASAQISIAVFPLKYASAADQTFAFKDSSVTVPGVASILQSVVSGQAIPGRMATYLPRDLAGLQGSGLDRFGPPRSPTQVPGAPISPPLQAAPVVEGDQSRAGPTAPPQAVDSPIPPESAPYGTTWVQPTISADSRLNAVVIRDYPERMPSYQQVVEALDRPTGLIEITAKIIDVSKRAGFEWGLPYSTLWTSGGQTHELSLQLSSTDAANFAVTLFHDQALAFVQRIKALEQEGNAQVVSRPTLLTMDNVEAQINNSETFYVRVEGSYQVDLFDVSVGTKLNIVPHIIEQNGQRVIKLTVQVEDGGVLQQTVDEIPRVRSDSLTTQAVLRENESLLIGGLFREEHSVTESRLPLFGRLPFVGGLFRTKEKNHDRVERLILIEPRIAAFPDSNGEQHFSPSMRPSAEACSATDLLPPPRPAAEVETAPPVETLPQGEHRSLENVPSPQASSWPSADAPPMPRPPAQRRSWNTSLFKGVFSRAPAGGKSKR